MVKMHWNAEQKVWEEKDTEDSLYLDGYLRQKLDNVKMLQRKDWDAVFIIVGMEGSGKSTLSFICGQYLSDMNLTINNIAAGSDDAIAKLQSLPDKSILIIDEAELLFSSRETMTREQRQLTKILMIIRQKKMVLILVSPSFFDLSKYISVDRSRFLIRTYTDKKLTRGSLAYWGQKKKMKLYTEGKKNNGSYSKPKPDFHGRFTNYRLPFDDEYQKTKMKSLLIAFEGKKKGLDEDLKRKYYDEMTSEIMKRNPGLKIKDYSLIFEKDLNQIKYLRYAKMNTPPVL